MMFGPRRWSILLLGAFLAAVEVRAQDESPIELPVPLSAEQVLASSSRHFPRVLQSLAMRRAASAKTVEAQGAFDLVFAADGFSRLSGFYDGTAVEGTAKQRLRGFGSSVYAGYKLSDGSFPIYEDINFTNSGGAFKLGVLFSLMRDRDIDAERFRETDSLLELQQAEFDVLLTRIGVQEQAAVAYWRWVAMGRKLKVYEELLRIAIDRQKGLEEQVRRGARAQIFMTENLQNITGRQIFVTNARRDLEIAANALSLYYREADGRPKLVDEVQLPPGAKINEVYDLAIPDETTIPQALAQRPELALLRTAIERQRNRIALAENNLKPRLDLNMEVQEGLGGIAEGGPSRDSTDTIVGFTFSVPLQQRAARGKLMRSRAELEAQQQEQQMRYEQIELEVNNLLVELNVSRELLLLAGQEVQQTEIMRVAELRRFESGASDFFLLNIREETAANARIRLLRAELTTRVARANYDAATVNTGRLGIDDLR